MVQCKDHWFERWLPTFCSTLIKKALQTPRISKLYSLLKTAMILASKHQYFEDPVKGEKLNTLNMLMSFFKELVGKQEEYQDELLIACLDLLIQVPVQLLYSKQGGIDNVYLWKTVMLKSLHIGLAQSTSLAMSAVTRLEHWFNKMPMYVTTELYTEVLPKLSEYLQVDPETSNGKNGKRKAGQEETQFQEMLKSNDDSEHFDRRDIAAKVLDLLGKIGGHAHSIINNE